MDWIEGEAAGFFGPQTADVFVGRDAFQSFEPTAKVVGGEEVGQVAAKLVLGFIAVALDGGSIESAVDPLDLPVGPAVVWFSQTVFDAGGSIDFHEGVETMAGDLAHADARQV